MRIASYICAPALATALIFLGIGAGELRAGNAPQGLRLAEAAAKASGVGTIKAVNAQEHKVRIAHEPIAALDWPAMTMAFDVAPQVSLEGLKPGTKVNFSISRDPKGLYVIDEISKAE